jgi:hypothetical protein
MKVGDRVKFRRQSKAWMHYGLEPEAKGYVVEVYQDAEAKGGHKIDVRFPGMLEPERGIDAEELEVLACAPSTRRPASSSSRRTAPGRGVRLHK